MAGRRAGRIANAGLALAGVLLTLGAAEVLTRLVFEPPAPVNFTPVPRSLRMAPEIPGVPYQMRPDATAVHEFGSDPRGSFEPGARLTYRTNSRGFRDREFPRHKPPGRFRILGLGDSFTFGSGVRREHTYLARLEERLNAGAEPPRFEVLNLGVMGYGTLHEVSLLEHVGLSLEPDLVLLAFFLNDARPASAGRVGEGAPEARRSAWRDRSQLLDHLAARFERRRAMARLILAYRESLSAESRAWSQVRGALAEAKRRCRSRGAELALLIFPVLWSLSHDYPFEGEHARIAAEVAALDIPVLDLLPSFAGFDGPELWVHPGNQHPNERAHELAAAALERFLVERGLLRPPGPRRPPATRAARRRAPGRAPRSRARSGVRPHR